MPNILELQNKLGKINEELRSVNDKADENGVLGAEDQAQYDKLDGEFRSVEAAIQRERDIEERAKKLVQSQRDNPPAAPKTPAPSPAPGQDEQRSAQLEAFEQWLRYGEGGLSDEQRSALIPYDEARANTPQSSGTASAGGYLVPVEYSNRLYQALKAYGGMLQVADVITTENGVPIYFPTADDTNNIAVLITENADHDDENTPLTFGQTSISSYDYTTKFIKVPNRLMRDAMIDISGYTTGRLSERLYRAINRHTTIGTGSGQPKGIVTAATNSGVTAAAAALTFDHLISLEHSVNSAYRSRPGVGFMFNDQTLSVIRKLKDNDGQYIWKMGNVQTGVPSTINGRTYTINDDMADVGANNASVLFGDFKSYMIRQAGSIRIVRANERFIDKDQTGFIAFMSLDGNLMDTRAVKKLVHQST